MHAWSWKKHEIKWVFTKVEVLKTIPENSLDQLLDVGMGISKGRGLDVASLYFFLYIFLCSWG